MVIANSGNISTNIQRRYITGNVDKITRTIIDKAAPIIKEYNGKDGDIVERMFSVPDLGLTYPCLVFTTTARRSAGATTAYSILILTTNPAKLDPVNVIDRNNTVVASYPGTLNGFFDPKINNSWDHINSVIKEYVANETKSSPALTTLASKFSAPVTTPDAEEFVCSDVFINNWLYKLSNANYNKLEILEAVDASDNKSFLNVNYLAGNIRNTYNLNQPPIHDINDNPIRADVSIVLNVSPRENHENSFATSGSRDIVTTYGYVDTSYNMDNSIQKKEKKSSYLSRYVNQSDTRGGVFIPPYDPVFIMTHFENEADKGVPATTEVVIAGILNAGVMANPVVWKSASYDPVFLDKENKLYNIDITLQETGLVLEGKEKFDYQEYLDTFWSSYPIFAVDVDLNGPNSTALDPLLKASGKTPESRKDIIDACSRFFGVNFNDYIGNAPIVAEVLRIQGGVYQASKEKRDIRERDDYIAALNTIARNPDDHHVFETLIDSASPGYRASSNIQDNLAVRYEILNQMVGGSFQPTTTISRLILAPQFIDALTNAALDSNVRINPTNAQRGATGTRYTGLNLRPYNVGSGMSDLYYR